ncbi:hypothetical protein XSR1_250033 [Xenorhabdus szentirmaii DSM 16338]|uniref:Uncharacterized protein n=1 Tax=Xenorhabdus szentirmaii DSM 16338 TaxID=1427518 RepID=W1IWH6_9GAMM|nr:hypothetical protein XSR1_250033 [Xenorhabdus szentirmaii DSM 16338]
MLTSFVNCLSPHCERKSHCKRKSSVTSRFEYVTYSACRYGAGSYGACGYVVMWLCGYGWLWSYIKHCYKRRAQYLGGAVHHACL